MSIQNNNPGAWEFRSTTAPIKSARRSTRSAGVSADLPPEFLREGVIVEEVQEAAQVKPSGRRGATPPPLDFSVDCAPGEKAVIVLRHPSGALTFHSAIEESRPLRGSSRNGSVAGAARFRITTRPTSEEASPTRGLISSLLKIIVVKVKTAIFDKLITAGVRLIAPAVETLWWNARGLKEGWFRIDVDGLKSGRLSSADMNALPRGERSLLFLHGTFSHAASAFRHLTETKSDFLSAVNTLYAGRIFAFNHFTLSRSPEENAKMLLEGLPDRECVFDVITHSRGGLVLRILEEQRTQLGPSSSRFRLGHAVLVGTPNAGTPLATPGRWEQTIGLLANLLEKFPDNPWTMAAEVVADGLVAIAGHAALDLPGLASMNSDGESILALQGPPGPRRDAYSALAANYQPEGAVWQRFLDAGIDSFFGGANDLAVPSEGSWLVDDPAFPSIPPERIGCFGPGGNLSASVDKPAHHLNFFAQEEAVGFILRALQGKPQIGPPMPPDLTLPSRRWQRGLSGSRRTPPLPPMRSISGSLESPRPIAFSGEPRGSEEFHLLILGNSDDQGSVQILATYGGARVLEPFETRNPKLAPKQREAIEDSGVSLELPGTRFQRILRIHKDIQKCLEGDPEAMPKDEELGRFGQNLFDALMRGNIRRLYDTARSEHREGPLNLIFTSPIAWLADIPWEFAFDPSRRKYLATEEVHFIRNVITAVPAQRIERKDGPLRILVAAAQPLGLPGLGIEDEIEKLRDDFRMLTEAGLAWIDILPRATPATLHDRLLAGTFDIVHFIGHGDFDEKASEGFLAFENTEGGLQLANTRTLRELLCSRGIQLIFLNACESGRGDKHVENRGVAQALVEGGLPAVVANQYKVLDPSAIAFAQRFYWSLTQGATLGEAAREARISLNYSIRGEAIDWAIPVVFARDPNYRLCEARKNKIPMPDQQPAESSLESPSSEKDMIPAQGPKRRIKSGASSPLPPASMRIALADLDRAFPDLEEWLATLNTVQPRFVFSLRHIVAPLGSWCLSKNRQYLISEIFAERIKERPSELGVDLLACLTTWPMLEKEFITDIYDWWGDKRVPITIFSTAGFAIPARGPETNRILTNSLVENLTGFLSQSRPHKKGPRDCPMYYNGERDFELMKKRMRFDKDCRRRLKSKIPNELPALEALLAAFHPDNE